MRAGSSIEALAMTLGATVVDEVAKRTGVRRSQVSTSRNSCQRSIGRVYGYSLNNRSLE